MRIALTRQVSPRLAECELSHLPREPIDTALAAAQHQAYRDTLAHLGCDVRELPATPDLPDGVFVEDPAVVFDEIAIIARSRATSRRPETATVEAVLREHRPIARITAPATLDGGDVLRVGGNVFVGVSARTNEAAVEQMSALLTPFGYRVEGVSVTGCLHLKSACTAVAPDLIVVNRAWIDIDAMLETKLPVQLLDVHADEPRGANHLLLDGVVLSPASCPRTIERMRARGVVTEVVDVSALEKAESGVTCGSLLFQDLVRTY